MFGKKDNKWKMGWEQSEKYQGQDQDQESMPVKMKRPPPGSEPRRVENPRKRMYLFKKWLNTKCGEDCTLCSKCIEALLKIVSEE